MTDFPDRRARRRPDGAHAVTSTNAARILGLYPKKGAIAAGSDADLVVFDPSVRKTIQAADLHGSDYSAWEGWEVHGWLEVVLRRGKVVVDRGKLLAQSGNGKTVARKLAAAMQQRPAV